MCNGNELHCQSNGNDYISKKCVMVMKKLQCNGNWVCFRKLEKITDVTLKKNQTHI